MKGTILGIDNEMVIVVDHENRRRRFSLSEWKSRQAPKAGMTIDFETVGEAQAKDAYSIPTAVEDDRGSSVQPKKAGGKGVVFISVIVLVVTVLAFVILLIPEGRQMMEEHLRARAESGSPEAQFELGRCLADGKYGMERDLVEAADWFQKGAGRF